MKIAFVGLLLYCSTYLAAQESEEKEPAAIVEIGAAPTWNVTEGRSSMRPTASAEFTLIPKWLKFEVGTSPTFGHRVTEWDTDFLLKKPWTISKNVELLAGPAWIHTKEEGLTSNSIAAVAVLDVMFWPTANRRVGWYIEPGYEYNFGKGHQHSVGFSAGLLIAFR